MGLSLGVGLLLGSRVTAVATVSLLLLIVFALVLLTVALPSVARPFLMMLSIGILGGWATSQLLYSRPVDDIRLPPDHEFTGTVETEPRMSSRGSHALVTWIDQDGSPQVTRAYLPLHPSIGRGDAVSIVGRSGFDAGGPVVFAARARVVNQASPLEASRRSVREHAAQSMIEYVPGSPGSLTLGLLIGDDTALSQDERQDLRASGLAHITAVSGWNVSLLVVSVGAVFQAFGARRWRWLAVQIVLLGGYVWVVGLEPPIVRAAIMGTVALVALQIGRPTHLLTHLAIAAGVMAVIDPEIVESLSFQLSFLAMLGLAVAVRVTRDLTGWKRLLLTPTVAAAAAGIATAPLLAASMGTVSLMTVPANLAAGPLVSFTTLGGIAVLATSWLWPAAEVLGWATWCLSRLILGISAVFANVPGGHHTFSPISPSATVVLYAALALLISPIFPEARAIGRRLEAWTVREPIPAFATSAVVVALVAVGIVLV